MRLEQKLLLADEGDGSGSKLIQSSEMRAKLQQTVTVRWRRFLG